ncbi:MAG TPA: BON domain-containing protein [Opitutaceae bacterium]|nr:BON domain-containing protein [Opitutaceae bacterium]
MKTSTLSILAVAALVLAGCNRSTKSSNTAASDSTPNADYTATASTQTSSAAATDSLNTAASNTADSLRNAGNSAENALGNAASNVATTARMTEWKLNSADIQGDLDANKNIVRTKDNQPGTATGSTDKSVIESLVKGRLEADSDISALKFRVSADRHGEVTLKGKADSAEQVGRAIALALDTEGVTKVTSKIRLNKDAKTNQ